MWFPDLSFEVYKSMTCHYTDFKYRQAWNELRAKDQNACWEIPSDIWCHFIFSMSTLLNIQARDGYNEDGDDRDDEVSPGWPVLSPGVQVLPHPPHPGPLQAGGLADAGPGEHWHGHMRDQAGGIQWLQCCVQSLWEPNVSGGLRRKGWYVQTLWEWSNGTWQLHGKH